MSTSVELFLSEEAVDDLKLKNTKELKRRHLYFR